MEELEKLQKNLDESFNDSDGEEAGVLCPKVLTTGSHSHPGKNSQESFFMIPAVCCGVYKFTQVAQGFVLFCFFFLKVNTDEENIEDDLEYLRRWATAPRERTISYNI